MTVDRQLVTDFFESLYDEAVSPENRLVVWTARDKRARWASSLSEAVDSVQSFATASDPYFGVCLQNLEAAVEQRRKRTGDLKPSMDFARGYASTTSVMPALWLDLDFAGPAHEKRNLPRGPEDAERILEKMPLAPSWILATGGGWHLYWVFHEPWVFEDAEERSKAAAIIQGWQTLAIDAAANMGFSMDATHDLARVLRPLGTTNHKYGTEVSFLERHDRLYNPSDFEDWVSSAPPPPTAEPARIESLGAVHDGLEPPSEKLMAMLTLHPQFAQTWRRERKEFPSQSEYDMSLASMAVRARWTDEEVVALIVAHRRAGGQATKADRPEYFARLLGKVRAGIHADEAEERLVERVDAVVQGDATPDEERTGFLTDVSSLLGFRIRRVLKYLGDPPQYRLVLDQGTIHLGGVEAILSNNKFRSAIAAVSGQLIQRMKSDRWDPVAQAILQSVEELDLGADSSSEGVLREWLHEYLSQHKPSLEKEEAIGIREPFWDEAPPHGNVCLFLTEFRAWLAFHRDERLSRRQLATLLRSGGCSPKVVGYTRASDGHRSTVQVWEVARAVVHSLPPIGQNFSSSGTAGEKH